MGEKANLTHLLASSAPLMSDDSGDEDYAPPPADNGDDQSEEFTDTDDVCVADRVSLIVCLGI